MSNYQIIDAKNRKKLREILSSKGQALLPFLDAIERTEIAIDEVIDVAGRATIEAVLDLSAQSVAGEKHPGKKGSDVRWHGRQGGVVSLAERKLRVSRPRLRRKGKAEGGNEIGIRTIRLSSIRGDLAVFRKRDDALASLRRAGQQVDDYLLRHANDSEWPTPAEIRALISRVRESEQEARQIISELRDLGADADLFKLNGD